MVVEKPRVFPFGTIVDPVTVCVYLRLDTVNVSIVEGILCFRQLILVGDKGRVYASSARGY